jgi:hypothetical protein
MRASFVFDLSFDVPTHGLGFRPLIDNAKIVHHFLLYGWDGLEANGTKIDCSGVGTEALVIEGWALGAGECVYRTMLESISVARVSSSKCTTRTMQAKRRRTAAACVQATARTNRECLVARKSTLGHSFAHDRISNPRPLQAPRRSADPYHPGRGRTCTRSETE